MTRPTSRVLELLDILQSGGTRTGAELAERLGVDERTVRRYVEHLYALDVPVESVRGRHGGYRLAPGYRMPPLMLTEDEALAVTLALVAGQQAGLVPLSLTAADAAAAKLRRVLPKDVSRRLDALLATTSFTAPPSPPASPEARVLLVLAEAARDRHPVTIGYSDREGNRTERTIQAYGLVAHSGRWYVAGADSISREIRTFRLDRIARPRVLGHSFSVPDGFDPAQHVLSGLAQTPWAHDVSVRIQGTLEQIRRWLPEGIAMVDNLTSAGEGWQLVRLRVQDLEWLPGILAAIGAPFTVERPEALRSLVLALGQRLIDSASPLP
ncbi:helix-turn-helix transcriptional regulator [Lacisediminihabitans profunda]|uniref:YafY family transcriptional regulator n=1 Tax=Lacisediminihabitans profunda TaxID=2594790 RepID=A0A5C8UMA0_9MICO|nr:YafY family protein [Lacisediminihabitans profunda]TXN29499.1 YafY family transcriptional regulator [Lacisediminihabitans profunda]